MTLIDLANPTRFLTLTARISPWLAGAAVILLPIGVPRARRWQASQRSA
jgi:heme exporter protein C